MSAFTDEKLASQKYALLPAFLKAKGLIRQHVSRWAVFLLLGVLPRWGRPIGACLHSSFRRT